MWILLYPTLLAIWSLNTSTVTGRWQAFYLDPPDDNKAIQNVPHSLDAPCPPKACVFSV
jgi:hypothetical protein